MIKVSGAFFLLLGAFGFAYSICREQKRKLLFLKNIREMYRLMQSEISYTSLPLPEIFKGLSKKLEDPLKKALTQISKDMQMEKGEDFSCVWKKAMEENIKQSVLGEPGRELLLRFPECIGMNESIGQARALDRYIEELGRMISQMEEEEKNKNKVTMSLGIAAGLVIVIILL